MLIIFGIWGLVQAQSAQTDPNVQQSEVGEIPLGGAFLPGHNQADFGATIKNVHTVHEPGPSSIKGIVKARKAIVNAQKPATKAPAQKTSVVGAPILGASFAGQKANGYPNDNHIAISNGGKIISVSNSVMYAYDESGGAAEAIASLSSLGDAGGARSFSKFDPRIIYDPSADRFIIVFLSGVRSQTSELVVGFSKGNNPAVDGWNMYVTTGSTHPDSWSDFPQIGISDDELFVTCNQYTDQLQYVGSTVWQFEKAGGYNNSSLIFQTYLTNYFSLHPVSGGDGTYGPSFYMIRVNPAPPNREVAVHRISNTLANGGTLEAPVSLQSDRLYDIPADAAQPGSNAVLLTNDTRIQDSYIVGNIIHWVNNTNFSGLSGIYYGTITLSPLSLVFSAAKGKYLTSPDYTYSYPGLSFAGWTGSYGHASIVGFNYVSSNDFPGNAALLVDGEGVESDLQICRKGKGFLGNGTESNRRWGDYVGVATRYNNIGEAWLGGSFGNITGGSDTYLTQLFASPAISVDNPKDPAEVSLTAFPNPAWETTEFFMEVEVAGEYRLVLTDYSGKEIAQLLSGYLRPGTARASFNVSPLANGIYLATVRNAENERVFTQKIIINR